MAKLTALSPINHDGELYEAGDTLELTDNAQVDALVSCGAAIVASEEAKAKKTKG